MTTSPPTHDYSDITVGIKLLPNYEYYAPNPKDQKLYQNFNQSLKKLYRSIIFLRPEIYPNETLFKTWENKNF